MCTKLLWSLLADITRGSAAVIVQRCKYIGNPNGREAEKEEVKGVRGAWEVDERSVRLLASDGGMRIVRHNAPGELSGFIVKLDSTWAQFETLGDMKPKETRRAAPLFLR